MTNLGRAIAPLVDAGDVLALMGGLGAGKSHLARSIIRTCLQDADAEVPSPTYTLVNVFDGPSFQIWHADLYRLSDSDEIHELGLADAQPSVLTLLEWPERWAELPPRRLNVQISGTGTNRNVRLESLGTGWDRLLDAIEAETWNAKS